MTNHSCSTPLQHREVMEGRGSAGPQEEGLRGEQEEASTRSVTPPLLP